MADNLQDLLDLLDEAWMVDRLGQLDVAEVTGTFTHGLRAGFALELSVDRAEERVVQASVAWLRATLFHGLRVENVGDAHVLDFLGRHEAKLDLLDRL